MDNFIYDIARAMSKYLYEVVNKYTVSSNERELDRVCVDIDGFVYDYMPRNKLILKFGYDITDNFLYHICECIYYCIRIRIRGKVNKKKNMFIFYNYQHRSICIAFVYRDEIYKALTNILVDSELFTDRIDNFDIKFESYYKDIDIKELKKEYGWRCYNGRTV